MSENWRSIDLRHLHALAAIASKGTFRAAAEALNASQSSVSDHIAALESLTGQRLIERSRGRRTVALTEAGLRLLGHAKAIEDRLHAAEADFRAFAAGESGTLHVGVYQSVANKVLPEVMRRFNERWPDVGVHLFEALHDNELVSLVERGDLDVSFAVQPIPDGPFEVRDLMTDPYVLIAAAGSALTASRPSVADLAGHAMVGYQPSRTVELAESFVHGRGVRPHVIFRSHDNVTVQAMVAAGLGVALAPLLAVDETDVKIDVAELRDPIPPRVLSAVWHRDRYLSPGAAAFVEMAASVAAEIEHAHNAFLLTRPGSK
jgi:molybdate transport repressor ModE-like protein